MTILEGGPGSGFLSGFASGYSLGFDEGIAVLPETRPRSFIDAIGRCLDADATLAALLGSLAGAPGSDPSMGWGSGFASGFASGFLIGSGDEAAATSGARKVWHGVAPARTDLPMIDFQVVPGSATNERVARWSSLSSGVLQVTAQARTWPAADEIARRAVAVLARGSEGDTIKWRSGRLMELWPGSPRTSDVPGPAPGSGLVWREVRQFKFMFSEEILKWQ